MEEWGQQLQSHSSPGLTAFIWPPGAHHGAPVDKSLKVLVVDLRLNQAPFQSLRLGPDLLAVLRPQKCLTSTLLIMLFLPWLHFLVSQISPSAHPAGRSFSDPLYS